MRSIGWIAAGASVLLIFFSGFADHRRQRRADLDRIGMVDWRTVQVAAIAGAIIAVSLAVNG